MKEKKQLVTVGKKKRKKDEDARTHLMARLCSQKHPQWIETIKTSLSRPEIIMKTPP